MASDRALRAERAYDFHRTVANGGRSAGICYDAYGKGNYLSLRAVVLCICFALHVCGQWINYPTPGIPRTSDGKPDLRAVPPKLADGKTDMSGIWVRIPPLGNPGGANFGNTVTYYMPAGTEVPLQSWAAELLHRRRYEDLGGGRPSERCLPHGVIGAMLPNTPFKIAHAPGVTFLLYEQLNQYRQIHRRPQLPSRSESDVVGLLRWPLGRRYVRGRNARLQ